VLLGYFSHLLELGNLHLLLTLLCLGEVIETHNLLPVILYEVSWLLRGHPSVRETATIAQVGCGARSHQDLLLIRDVVDARRLF
jgi:hypothetical protein